MSTSRVNEGLQGERVVTRILQSGVRRSLQEEKVGYLLLQNSGRDHGGAERERLTAVLENSTGVEVCFHILWLCLPQGTNIPPTCLSSCRNGARTRHSLQPNITITKHSLCSSC